MSIETFISWKGKKYELSSTGTPICLCDRCMAQRKEPYVEALSEEDFYRVMMGSFDHSQEIALERSLENRFGKLKQPLNIYADYDYLREYKCRCLTFTVDDTVVDYNILWNIVHKIVEKKQFAIKYWYAALELTKQKIPHIHMIIYYDKANKRGIDTSWIKKQYKYRFDCSKPKDGTGFSYLQYLLKDLNDTETKVWCEENVMNHHNGNIIFVIKK